MSLSFAASPPRGATLPRQRAPRVARPLEHAFDAEPWWDDNVAKDADGRFFIDQPAHLFMPLVDFRYEPYDDPNPKQP